jgi:hypothetical protein
MLRLLCLVALWFWSPYAFPQMGARTQHHCDDGFLHRERVWSPDCNSYFLFSSHKLFGPMDPFLLRVYTLPAKGMPQVGSPLEEVECSLALEALACTSTELHQVEWVGSDRLRLRVRTVCGAKQDVRELAYLVEAQSGRIIDGTGPVRRNWSCPKWSERAYGGTAAQTEVSRPKIKNQDIETVRPPGL